VKVTAAINGTPIADETRIYGSTTRIVRINECGSHGSTGRGSHGSKTRGSPGRGLGGCGLCLLLAIGHTRPLSDGARHARTTTRTPS
jgi:hypothetical protein